MALGISTAIHTLLNLGEAGDTINDIRKAKRQTSRAITKVQLVKAGRITRVLSEFVVEPIIICSMSTRDISIIDKLIALNTDIFATFYAQVFQILNEFYRVDHREIIDIMGTSSSTLKDPITQGLGGLGGNGLAYTTESYNYIDELFSDNPFISLEANPLATAWNAVRNAANTPFPGRQNQNNNQNQQRQNNRNTPARQGGRGSGSGSGSGGGQGGSGGQQSNASTVQQITNVLDRARDADLKKVEEAVEKVKQEARMPYRHTSSIAADDKLNKLDDQPTYKMHVRNLEITVKVLTGEEKEYLTVKLPMVVKAHVLFVKLEEILALLKPNSNEKSFIFRWYAYRAGSIGLSDLLFASDLIKEYRETKKKDKSQILDITNTRAMDSMGSLIDPAAMRGFEANYNMIIVDQHDKKQIDAFMRGDTLKNKKEALLEQGHSIVYNVIDTDYERVDITIRDMLGKMNLSFKQVLNRKTQTDELGDLLKSMLTGKTMGIM